VAGALPSAQALALIGVLIEPMKAALQLSDGHGQTFWLLG